MSKRTKQLLKENNELEKQINSTNTEILTDIIVYIRSANISVYKQEVVRRDIIQMIIDGENRGSSAADVIGGDYKNFCDSILNEIPKLSVKEKVLSSLRDTGLSIIVLTLIWLCFNVIDILMGANSWPYVTITLGNIISGMLIICTAFGLFTIFSKNSFNKDFLRSKKMFLILFSIVTICICANTFLNYKLFKIHMFIAVIGIMVLFIVYKIIDNKVD